MLLALATLLLAAAAPPSLLAPGAVPGSAEDAHNDAARDPLHFGAASGPATVSLDGARRRATALLGATVHGSDNERLGTVSEVLFDPAGGDPGAVIALGAAAGLVGGRLVLVPLSSLQHGERWVLPGATRSTLREQPEFRLDPAR